MDMYPLVVLVNGWLGQDTISTYPSHIYIPTEINESRVVLILCLVSIYFFYHFQRWKLVKKKKVRDSCGSWVNAL